MAEASINAISEGLKDLTISKSKIKPAGGEIGRGAYGRVFTVKYCGHICAVKEIHSILVEGVGEQEQKSVKEGFLRECHHCSVLKHPNIVRFLGIYYPQKHSKIPAMIMELMDESLTAYMKKLPKTALMRKGSILLDVAEGLSYLHALTPAVIHRDLSPNNILLKKGKGEVPVAKISDLGVAKVVKADSRATRSKLTKAPGTVDFMAPEALQPIPDYGVELDVFSFAGIVLFVCTHKWPTPTAQVLLDPETDKPIAFTEVERRQEYLDEMTGEAKGLRPLVESCLSNNPAKRPTIAEVSTRIKVLQKGIMQEILDRLFKNPSNTMCAECNSTDPVWASVNLGIMLCINCSGVHRSMGTHISKVWSTELDQNIWTDGLIDLIVNIGNKNSNEFWEKHCQQSEKLAADVERDIRENFIRAKYELKAWIPRSPSSPPEVLGKQLCEAVKTSNVMTSLELIIRGANVNFVNMRIKGENNTPLLIAKEHQQSLQMELLVQNGATIPGNEDEESDEPVNKQGYLFKTGSERTGWRKRYCSLDKTGFKYYKSEHDSEVLGEFPVEEMLSVTISEDDSFKDPHYKYCFEVATARRLYLLCAEKDFELQQWVAAFQKIIPTNAKDILGFGYIYYKGPSGWKRKWCTLKRKEMCLYKTQDEKEIIDLHTAIDLRGPDTQGSFEAQCSFQIVTPGRLHALKADNGSEADAWYSALRHTQVSGLPLQDQELTNSGIPIIVHKCLQFVESHGLDSEGIYRLSGNKTRVQKLILAFNQDAKGFIVDPETYLVNDVVGTLKQFLRSLPDPLLTHHLYAAFINAAQIQDAEERRTHIQSLVEQLPAVNRETLKRLIGHLRKVADNASVNKMSVRNIVRIFGPTVMTVDSDESTFVNANYEFCVVESMFRQYHWMFQVDEDEQKKEEAMQEAMKKLELAQQMQRMHTVVDSKFLVTVFVNGKDGQAFTSKVSQVSTAGHLAEETARSKKLPPDMYALYIVLGNSEAERALHPSERVLTVMQTVQCDFFFRLKLNAFAERVRPYMSAVCEVISVNLREKKKWRKYPCTVKSSKLILYRDNKMNHELSRTSVHEFDMFFGTMSDVKNPAPTGHQLYLKARLEEHSKYICADREEDMLKCAGAIAHAKYPEGFPTPMIPEHPIVEEIPEPQPTTTTKARHYSEEDNCDPDIYVNVKLSKKSKTLQNEPSADLLRELSSRLKKS